jgi:Xaa-Pro aminopeptidase
MRHPQIPIATFRTRRTQLRKILEGPILLMGNLEQARNFPANHLPFRQDSSFWYFTGCTQPNAAWFSSATENILFLPEQHPNDVLWHGAQESNAETTQRLGFDKWMKREDLDAFIGTQDHKEIHTIAVSDYKTNQWLTNTLYKPFVFGTHNGSDDLIEAIISMRRILDDDEIEQLRWTANITREAHIAAMKATSVGKHELDVASAFHHPIHKAGLDTAYHSIITVDGEILHNHAYKNDLQQGDLLLLDGGAESPYGYATDVTRTWPVSGTFTGRQKRAYSAVLMAQEASIQMVRNGVRYRHIHDTTSTILTEFLVSEELLRGKVDDLMEQGAHALFFPHGVGHLLGLDVHDMENFGDRVAYAPGRVRSEQFGTGYLRMDLDLEPNMVVTIEPGFYMCPAIFNNPTLRERFNSVVNWERVQDWMGFGGIRIEDDIRCTDDAPENLTGHIPKSIEDISALVGSLTT